MELDISARVEAVLGRFHAPSNELEIVAVQELKTQAKQALLQVALESREAQLAVERWAGVQKASLPESLRRQSLRDFCRQNPHWQPSELTRDNPE